MKTYGIVLILCIVLLSSVLPLAGAESQNTTMENESYLNIDNTCEIQNLIGNEPISKQFLIGRIKDLDSYYHPWFGNVTSFTIVRAIAIQIFKDNESRVFGSILIKEMPVMYVMDQYQFKGILKNRFICGIWEVIFN